MADPKPPRGSKQTDFSRALRRVIQDARFTSDAEAAEVAGIKPKQLSKWLSGENEPMISSLLPVLHSWKQSLADLEGHLCEILEIRSPHAETLRRIQDARMAMERAESAERQLSEMRRQLLRLARFGGESR